VNDLCFAVFPDTESRAENIMLIKEYGLPKERKRKISAVFSLHPQVVHLDYDTIEENP